MTVSSVQEGGGWCYLLLSSHCSPVPTRWPSGESRAKHSGKMTGHKCPGLVAGKAFPRSRTLLHVLTDLGIQQILLCARTPEGTRLQWPRGGRSSRDPEQPFELPSSSPARENLTILDASLKRILMTTGFVSVTGHRNQREEETKTQNQTDS